MDTTLVTGASSGIGRSRARRLASGKHIPSQHGSTKGLLRCHPGLIVPHKTARYTTDVGNERCRWQERKVLFFDDTYPHQVRNDTQNQRIVLLLDVRRPRTWRGAVLGRLQLWLLRRTAYVQDAGRNQARWEQAVRDLV